MKLLLLVNSIHPGGAENFAFYLVKYLKKLNYDISIAYVRDIESRSGEYNFQELSKDFPLHWLGKKHNSGMRGLYGALQQLKKLDRKNKYDIILSACELPDLFAALLKTKALKVRTLQNSVSWAHKPWFGKLIEPYLVSPRLAYHVAVSESVKNIWIATYGVKRDRVNVVPNGAHDVFYEVKEKRSITPGQPIKLGVVARLEPQKGHIYLLQALKELKGQLPVQLGLVGKGTLEEELRQYVADNDLGDRVHFHGWYTRDEVCAFYKSIDVLVMSSLFEGLPLNGVEAMATGLPVIGSRVPGIVDFLNDNNGLLFEGKNYRELAQCIERIATDAELYARLSEQSRREAVQYHFSTISAQYHTLFTNLLQR
jgi:glycosyltransferase involved in cell wall biosynthesis